MQYICKECGAQCKKTPLKAVKGWKSAPMTDFVGLGKWRCPRHGKVAVRRVKKSDT